MLIAGGVESIMTWPLFQHDMLMRPGLHEVEQTSLSVRVCSKVSLTVGVSH